MAGSRFAGHIRVWLLAAPLMLCVLAPMLPESERFEIGADEQTSVEAVLGEVRALVLRKFVRESTKYLTLLASDQG